MPDLIYRGVDVDCGAAERLFARKGIEAVVSYELQNFGDGLAPRVERVLCVSVALGTPADDVNRVITRLSKTPVTRFASRRKEMKDEHCS